MSERTQRSREWSRRTHPRYWWHRLSGMEFVPPIYSDLRADEWEIIRGWYAETDRNDRIGECAVPLISFLHGIVMGNRVDRIVQLGTCSGYSALLLGFMLRRMNAAHGLFTIDVDPEMCALARRWITRARLDDFVEIAELNSTDRNAPSAAQKYLHASPDLIIIDSSHEYASTQHELDLWYPTVAPGGLIVLHDVSRFAAGFDLTQAGGVRRAFDEWRKLHNDAETFCLNGEARSMQDASSFYKDFCGLGLIHKPGVPES
jgi:predicted O-methyltransferase YrrM